MLLSEEVRAKLDSILDSVPGTEEEKLQLLREYELARAEKAKMNPAKLMANTHGELIVCNEKGYKWSKKLHGCDAWDKGQAIEIKATFKIGAAVGSNFNYSFPIKKGESAEQHALRTAKELLESFPGGHRWAVIKSSGIVQFYSVSAQSFAKAVYEYLKRNPLTTHLNLGNKWCRNCGYSHRIEAIATMLNCSDTAYHVFPRKVSQQCTNQKVKVKVSESVTKVYSSVPVPSTKATGLTN